MFVKLNLKFSFKFCENYIRNFYTSRSATSKERDCVVVILIMNSVGVFFIFSFHSNRRFMVFFHFVISVYELKVQFRDGMLMKSKL